MAQRAARCPRGWRSARPGGVAHHTVLQIGSGSPETGKPWYLYFMAASTTGLARVTISSAHRRVDVALPEAVPLAELLPDILRHAGDGLADDGERHGGWALRRGDGALLDPATTLLAHGVRDGTVLHLVPAMANWPELEYDDVVEAIAAGARRAGTGWNPLATRVTGLTVAGVAAAVGLVAVCVSGPPWHLPAIAAFVVAVVLLVGGVFASRAYGDAVAGATLAAYALPYAFTGGVMVLAGNDQWRAAPRTEVISYLLVGSVALLLVSLLAAVGVGYALRLFAAGATIGVIGILCALLAYATSVAGAAAVTLAVLVAGVAGVPLLAIRLGKLPMPAPALPADLSATGRGMAAQPDRAQVFAAVARTDEMLTGMLLAIALSSSVAFLLVGIHGGVSGRVLIGVAAAALLLRARLFVTVRQRLPLITAGVVGFVLLAGGALGAAGSTSLLVGLALALVVLLVASAAVRYASRVPSPYLGRAADILDMLCVVSVVPVACAVLGLYGLARGIAG